MSRQPGVLSAQDFSLMVIRAMVGVVFIAHGAQKFGIFGGPGIDAFAAYLAEAQLHVPYVAEPQAIPSPQVAAWLAALTEALGGGLLVIGLMTRVAALLLTGTMAVAIMTAHHENFFLTVDPPVNGMEYALTLGVICFALVIGGSGRLTLFGILSGRAFRSDEAIAQARAEKQHRKRLLVGEGLDGSTSSATTGPLAAAVPPPAPRPGTGKPSAASRSQPPPPMRPDMRPSDDADTL